MQHAPTAALGAAPSDVDGVEIRSEHPFEFRVELGEGFGEIGLDAAKDVADGLVETPFDQTHGAPANKLQLLSATFQFVAQAAQLVLDLANRPRSVPDASHFGFEVRAERRGEILRRFRPRRLQHHVGRVEHPAEQVELGAEYLQSQPLCLVVLGEEVDDRDVALLPIAVAATNALLDALRIPGQIVVHDGVAELHVKALRAGLGGDQHYRAGLEFVDQGAAHRHTRARPLMRRHAALLLFPPDPHGFAGTRRIVDAAEQGDVRLVEFGLSEEQIAQVVLGSERLGEDHHFTPILGTGHDHPHSGDQALRLAVARQRVGAAHEVLHQRQLVAHRRRFRRGGPATSTNRCVGIRVVGGSADVRRIVFEIVRERRNRIGVLLAAKHRPQPVGDPVKAGGERRRRRRHAAVEAEQQQLARASLERAQPGPQQILGDVVVEGALGRTHAVLEQPGAATDERLVEKVLRLAPQRALHHSAKPAFEFLGLLGRDPASVAAGAEDLLEHRLRTEQRAAAVDVLDQRPQFGQRVLNRRRRQQQHRRGADDLAHPMRRQRVPAVVAVAAVAVEPPMDAGEHLVGFVDQAEIEGRPRRQAFEPAAAACVLATDQENARTGDVDLLVRRLRRSNAEQVVEFVLPLPQQRTRHHHENPARSLRKQLRDHEAGFNGLAEAHFVGEDAAAFRDSAQREHHRVDLVRVGIDPASALRRHLPKAFAGAPQPHEFLRVVAAMNRVRDHAGKRYVGGHEHSTVRPTVRASSPLHRPAPPPASHAIR